MLRVGGRLVVLSISDITATMATAAIASSGSFFFLLRALPPLVLLLLLSLYRCFTAEWVVVQIVWLLFLGRQPRL